MIHLNKLFDLPSSGRFNVTHDMIVLGQSTGIEMETFRIWGHLTDFVFSFEPWHDVTTPSYLIQMHKTYFMHTYIIIHCFCCILKCCIILEWCVLHFHIGFHNMYWLHRHLLPIENSPRPERQWWKCTPVAVRSAASFGDRFFQRIGLRQSAGNHVFSNGS